MKPYTFLPIGKHKPPRSANRCGNYPSAVAWIVEYDQPWTLDQLERSLAVRLVAAVFHHTCHDVAHDVWLARTRTEAL